MSDTIKILHVIGSGGYGGRERMLHLLLREEKKDPQLISEVYFLQASGIFHDNIKKEGIVTHHYDPAKKLSWLNSDTKLFENFDILLYHTSHWRILLIGILSGRPIIYRLSGLYLTINKSFRDVVIIFFEKIFQLVSKMKNRTDVKKETGVHTGHPNNVLPNMRSGTRLIRRWQFIVFLNLFCDKIIVNSRYALNSLTSKYYVPVNKRKIALIPNGINTDIELPNGNKIREEFNIGKELFVIGTVCRFDVRKRIDRLLEGFVELATDPRMMLMVVGGGDDTLEKGFKDYVEKKKLSSKVIFTGYRSDTLDCIDAMDLFVLPSDNESCPNALMEAMLIGKPSIVFSDSGGPIEIIGPGTSLGYIIQHQSELKDIAQHLASRPEAGIEIGHRASEYVREKLSIRFYKKQYKEIYAGYHKA